MSDKVRPSFDQYIAKRGEPKPIKDARLAYEAAVRKLAATSPNDKDWQTVRDAKKAAGVALSDVRQAEEAKYYEEEIEENVKAITEMKQAAAATTESK